MLTLAEEAREHEDWAAWCRSEGYAGKVYGDPAGRGYAGCWIAA